eukprot:gene8008-10852_t
MDSHNSELWEKMLLEERKQKAHQLGIRVCDLEEIELYEATIANSTFLSTELSHVSNSTVPSIESKSGYDQTASGDTFYPNNNSSFVEKNVSFHNHSKTFLDDDLDEDNFDIDPNIHYLPIDNKRIIESNSVTQKRLNKSEQFQEDHGGPWIFLPQDIVDKILIVLGDIDMCGYLKMTSKSVFRPSEAVYKYLCELTYLKQTTRKLLKIENWKTWYNMLTHRPRIRTNGFYTLRTMYSKAPSNDAFWEEKKTQSIEVRFYRHFRFFDDGCVLYCQDIIDPYDMVKMLEHGKPINKRLFEGRYTFSRREIRIQVNLHYCRMFFVLSLLDGDDGYIGKHNMLKMLSHQSTSLFNNNHMNQNILCNQYDESFLGGEELVSQSRVTYNLPRVCDFRYYRVWSFSSRQKL